VCVRVRACVRACVCALLKSEYEEERIWVGVRGYPHTCVREIERAREREREGECLCAFVGVYVCVCRK
jgi:hypothetical protein